MMLNPAIEDDPLLNDKVTAKLLGGINPDTLSVWRSTNRYPDLAYIKIGRNVRYRKSDVLKFIESRKVGGPATK